MKHIYLTICFLAAMFFAGAVSAQDGSVRIAGTSARTDSLLYPASNAGVTGEEISAPAASITNMLYGRIPGLTVSASNGEPGYDAATLSIRGIATYNNASIPVYVDGYQTNASYFNYMSASEIESIRILKDAAELAPFGMRGANGVIWVTTKRGGNHKPVINFEVKSGVQQLQSFAKPYGTDDYGRLYNEAYSNDNGNVWNPVWSAEDIAGMPDVDWHKAVLKNASPYAETNLSVSGGSEITKYFVSFGYMNQQGLYDVPFNDTLSNAAINRFNLMANLDIALGKWIEAGIGVGGRIETRQYPNRSASSLWNDMAKYPSGIYPIRNQNGTWTGTPVYDNNPVASINALGRTSSHDRTLQFNMSLKEKLDFLVPGLYLKESVALSSWARDDARNTRTYARYYKGAVSTTDIDTPYERYEGRGTNQWNWKHFTVTAGYDGNWGKHGVSASVDGLYNIYNTDANQNGAAGSLIWYRHANVSGAAVYEYDRRVSASLTFAASGSDNYRPGHKWGFYPAAGIGYAAIDSRDGVRNVDFLKLRASAGLSGWDPMGEMRFLWESYHYSSGGINLGNGSPSWNSGFLPMYEANPDIFAESSAKYDIGFSGIFFGRLSADATFFYERRSGIVTQDKMLPGTAGIENPAYRNIGKVSNKGFDASISWKDRVGEFEYSAGVIGSYASDRIDYMAEIITVATAAQTGHPIGSVFGYVADGFYDAGDFDADGNLLPGFPAVSLGNVRPGDVKYKDLNGDKVIDELDKTFIANPSLPRFTYAISVGLAWRGIDFSAILQGTGGRKVNLLDAPLQTLAFRDNGNVYPIAEERWAYYPEQGIDTRDTARYPRLSLQDNNNNYANSTLWIRNGDFLKLRNIEIGYTFPKRWMSVVGIEKLRVSFCALNILTISTLKSKYSLDPEVLSGHPALKSYNFGVNITF